MDRRGRRVLDHWRRCDAPILPRITTPNGDRRFWQPGGGHDRNVIGDELIEKIIYVHNNPIARRLSPDSISWRWSSARAYRGHAEAIGPPIAFDLIPPTKKDLT